MLTIHQLFIFGLGWLSYASTYLLRKPIGVIKSALQNELHLSTEQLGWFDISLLLPYAFAQILLGSIPDHIGSRKTLSLCLILSGVSMVTFGKWSTVTVLCLLLFMNGFSQALSWPSCTKILSSWFSDDNKNSVFGLFGTCAFAGGIMGTSFAVGLLKHYGSWRDVHLIPSVIVIIFGVLVFLFYKEANEVSSHSQSKVEAQTESKTAAQNPSLFSLARLPGVVEIAISVFCLKLVRYCMYMWLPLFLEKQLNYTNTEAGMFSTMFEVGGVLGSALLGILLDRYASKNPLVGVTLCIILSAVSFILFNLTSSWGHLINSVLLFLAGAFNCGPDTILGGALPNKLGQQDGLNAGAAVTGIINGFGSVGTVIEGPIIAFVSGLYGWSAMFYLTIVLTILGAVSTYTASHKISF